MVNWKRIREFIIFTFLINFSLVGIYLIIDQFIHFSDQFPYAMTILATTYMFIPFMVSLILIKGRYKEKLRDYGIQFRFNGYWILAWIVPLLITIGTIEISLLFKFGTPDYQFTAFFENLKEQIGEEAFLQAKEQIEKMGFSLILLQTIFAGTTINTIFAFGEEAGWRGFLYKELHPLGFWKSGAFIGLIWGLWHAPLILMGHNFPEYPRIGVLVMTIACVPLSILIQYVRVKTKTVFSAAVMHGMFNAVAGFAIIIVNGGSYIQKNPLGISGIITMGVLVFMLFIFMKVFPSLNITENLRNES